MNTSNHQGLERTAKIYEKYNRDKDRFEFVGKCPLCSAELHVFDEHNHDGEPTIEGKCQHYDSIRWGCGGVIMFFKPTPTQSAARTPDGRFAKVVK
jgi:hypothetical protein